MQRDDTVAAMAAGLLLTGGSSRRMGRDKAELVIAGERLADRSARVLAGVCDPVLEVGPGRSAIDAVVDDEVRAGPLVALATGAAALALGTDTGGSIRIPASFCGISGLKPTYGRISTEGVYPLARSLDHAGPMGRTPEDVRLLYEALAGRAYGDPARRIATCPDLHVRPLEPGIRRAFEAAVAALDAEVVKLGFDAPDRLYPTYATIQNAEAALTHAALYPSRRADYGDDVAARLDYARDVTLAEYAEAIAERERIRAAFAHLLSAAELLITPISAVPPEPIEQPTHQEFRDGVLPYTVPQDLAGLPACAVPVGFDDAGLPVGVQLTGPPWSEGRVLATAERLYAATASARAGSVSAP
jgi:aspartyl-tRNA(Asn)/glutamyl-tRNA(Gln) amidotransferase subunit A